jgi:GNAT superfamily N-acetyltransferase
MEHKFEVKILTDKSKIPAIQESRRLAWQNSDRAILLQDDNFVKWIWDDREDDIFFVIEHNDLVAASGRIRMLNDLENLREEYKSWNLPDDRPFGDYERVSVHPDYRGLGLVYLLDDFILKYVAENKIPFIIGEFIPPRDKTALRLGYRLLGILPEIYPALTYEAVACIYIV